MRKKLSYILLSVLIAFGLWYYVISVVSPGSEDEFVDIPVVLEGQTALEERGLMVTGTGKTTVTLRLSGNRSDLNELNRNNITIKANLATIYDPGENIQLGYTISYPGSVPNNAFVEESRNPSYITVTVERKISREIPVNVITTGTLPSGFTVLDDEKDLDYEYIWISGPESVMDQISQATIQVDLTDRTESINDSFRVTLCDSEGNPVNSELITVYTEEVYLNLPIRMLKTIPLKVNVIDGGGATEETTSITFSPSAFIEVHGTAAALEDLDEIILGTINLADYAKAAELEYEITLPEGVTNRTGSKVVVKLEFPALSTKTFAFNDIKAINIPEGMEATLTTQMLDITLRGPSSEIANITAEDITVTVDFANAAEGTASFKVLITIDAEFPGTGALGSYSVYATISEVEQETE